MDFHMFFGILIFEPKCGFCMGYSLCVMADFQIAHFSNISCFLKRFLDRITVNDL